jgi:hypothetical protein
MRSQTSAKANRQESVAELQANRRRAHPKSLILTSANWLTPMFSGHNHFMSSATSGENYPGENGPLT